eukprot:COSAG04_NODE_6424_length_1329_cov_1.717886_1_plen_213_part_10
MIGSASAPTPRAAHHSSLLLQRTAPVIQRAVLGHSGAAVALGASYGLLAMRERPPRGAGFLPAPEPLHHAAMHLSDSRWCIAMRGRMTAIGLLGLCRRNLCLLGRFWAPYQSDSKKSSRLTLYRPSPGRVEAELRWSAIRGSGKRADVVGAPAPLAAEMIMKPARLLPYLSFALAAALLVVAGVVAGWHTAAAPDAAALRRELLEGVVPAAAH